MLYKVQTNSFLWTSSQLKYHALMNAGVAGVQNLRITSTRLAATKEETLFCWVGMNQTVPDRLERVFVDLNQVTLKTHSGANSSKRFFCFVLECKNLRREKFSGQPVEAFGVPWWQLYNSFLRGPVRAQEVHVTFDMLVITNTTSKWVC